MSEIKKYKIISNITFVYLLLVFILMIIFRNDFVWRMILQLAFVPGFLIGSVVNRRINNGKDKNSIFLSVLSLVIYLGVAVFLVITAGINVYAYFLAAYISVWSVIYLVQSVRRKKAGNLNENSNETDDGTLK